MQIKSKKKNPNKANETFVQNFQTIILKMQFLENVFSEETALYLACSFLPLDFYFVSQHDCQFWLYFVFILQKKRK